VTSVIHITGIPTLLGPRQHVNLISSKQYILPVKPRNGFPTRSEAWQGASTVYWNHHWWWVKSHCRSHVVTSSTSWQRSGPVTWNVRRSGVTERLLTESVSSAVYQVFNKVESHAAQKTFRDWNKTYVLSPQCHSVSIMSQFVTVPQCMCAWCVKHLHFRVCMTERVSHAHTYTFCPLYPTQVLLSILILYFYYRTNLFFLMFLCIIMIIILDIDMFKLINQHRQVQTPEISFKISLGYILLFNNIYHR